MNSKHYIKNAKNVDVKCIFNIYFDLKKNNLIKPTVNRPAVNRRTDVSGHFSSQFFLQKNSEVCQYSSVYTIEVTLG